MSAIGDVVRAEPRSGQPELELLAKAVGKLVCVGLTEVVSAFRVLAGLIDDEGHLRGVVGQEPLERREEILAAFGTLRQPAPFVPKSSVRRFSRRERDRDELVAVL